MRLDLYQAETAQIASQYAALLDDARQQMATSGALSPLEQNGVLHAVQVLIENAIGKAKQCIKVRGETVPVSAYDAFAVLAQLKIISEEDLPSWNAAIGLRNRIVHEYMNLDIELVLKLVQENQLKFIIEFLLQAIDVDAVS